MYSLAEYIEELEIKNYIQQFQNLTPAQLEKMLLEETHFRPPQEQNHCLQKALVELLEQADPTPQDDSGVALATFSRRHSLERKWRPRPRKRLVIAVSAVIMLLLLSAVAYAVQHWGLYRSIQERFTHPRTVPGPEAVVKTWTELPVPTYTPADFYISDAVRGDGLSTIEYCNITKKMSIQSLCKTCPAHCFHRRESHFLLVPTHCLTSESATCP